MNVQPLRSAQLQQTAATCIAGATSGAMSFPDVVRSLSDAGFEGYQIDLRTGTATYYTPAGEAWTLRGDQPPAAPAPRFDTPAVVEAIREAQRGDAGYTYAGFCEKIAAAGCVGYLVSFPGRRALYIGRTGETHTEHFPS